MPRYFFHLHSGALVDSDDQGLVLPDMVAATREAKENMRGLVLDAITSGAPVTGWQIEIANRAGRVLGTMHAREVLH